ncbi:MAG TPA: hypothetical protein VG267_08160 [Terracidiphilus sp.]|jgi:hypothetical protein|nr:hypothetical protein [Terracidiphilus sp.]
MTIESILSQIDDEIARLTQARNLLATAGAGPAASPRRKPTATARKSRKSRVLSADARKRIADAQRRRWAAQKAKGKKESA